MSNNNFKFVKYLLFPFCLIAGLYMFVTTIAFLFAAESSGAKIISINFDGESYQPTLEYTINNKIYHHTPKFQTGNNEFSINQSVNILYNKDYPTEAKIDTFIYLWGPSILSFFVGFGIYFISFLLHKQSNKN